MVELVLAAIPLLAGLAILVLGLGSSLHPDAPGSPIPIVYAILVGTVVVLAVIAAVRRRRETNRVAWVLLMVGVVVYSMGEILELLLGVHDLWVEDVLRLAAYLPLVLFVASVTSPLALVARHRAATRVTVIAVILVVLGVGVSLAPYLLWGTAGRFHELAELLTAVRPVLDLLVMIPLLGILATAGLRRLSLPYVYVSCGLVLLAVSDVFYHYDLIRGSPQLEVVAFAGAIAAMAYFVLASLRRLTARRPG